MATNRIPDPGVAVGAAATGLGLGLGFGTGPGAVVNGVIDGAKGTAGDVVDAASSVAQGVGDITDSARAVRRWISDRHNWARVAWFGLGSAMFTVGVVMVGERPIASGVNAVTAPVGKVIKGVSPL